MEHLCETCKYQWFNNHKELWCPLCQNTGITNWFDDYNEESKEDTYDSNNS